jgi:hypothetical protein
VVLVMERSREWFVVGSKQKIKECEREGEME